MGILGFVSEGLTVDTDADLVLIDGPNGFGKTSLIDAMLLTCGCCYHQPVVSAGKDEGFIRAEVVMAGSDQPQFIEVNVRLKENLTVTGMKLAAT